MNIRPGHTSETEARQDDGFVPGYLLYLLAAASEAASGDFHAKVRARGIRVPEWRVLACLADRDGQMVTQLALLALMEQSHLTKIIDQMEQKGMVTRANDRRDRRRVRVFLTDEGRELARELVMAARAHEVAIASQLPPGEAVLLKDALRRIKALYGPVAPGLDEVRKSGNTGEQG